MATPNYSYEKRQRELAKKRKKEEKLKRKAANVATDDAVEAPPETDTTAEPSPPIDDSKA